FKYEVPNEHFRRLQKEYPQDVNIKGNLCTYYYQFNAQKAPFNDVRVRKAMSYAMDRDIVTKAILGQGQKPAYFLTPEITAGFDPVTPEYGQLSQKERI
ncbi:ABC transporter substrate-binding protein, partial [Vibrio sp. T20]|uniref:ABC transporter substrate-binding protein n=1 Tax=Vibrio sp. T20 TaxID=2588450 RepID=UPI0021BDBCB2